MAKVKICGLRRPEDIQMVNEALPDYIGFIFAPSKRRLGAQEASDLAGELKKQIKKVGVFVNEKPETILKIAGQVGLDVIQLHGDEGEEDIRFLQERGLEVWKALRIRSQAEAEQGLLLPADRLLMDSFVPRLYGGSGKRFDPGLLRGINPELLAQKVIVAGGLDLENIAEIMDEIKPYAFDVSSGVETDGWKDGQKVKRFVQTVKGSAACQI